MRAGGGVGKRGEQVLAMILLAACEECEFYGLNVGLLERKRYLVIVQMNILAQTPLCEVD